LERFGDEAAGVGTDDIVLGFDYAGEFGEWD